MALVDGEIMLAKVGAPMGTRRGLKEPPPLYKFWEK